MSSVIFKNEYIRQGILSKNEYANALKCARTEAGSLMKASEIIAKIADSTGWGQVEMSKRFGVAQSTISKWKNEESFPNTKQWANVLEVIRRDPRLWYLRFEAGAGVVPIVGKVGAGHVVEPEMEQVPSDGLYSVTLPFAVPADMVGFVVEGDSMFQKYDEGDVLVVYKDQPQDTASYLGQFAVVRTKDGRRFVKRLFRGTRSGLYRLESLAADPIQDVEIAWVGEIFTVVPRSQVFKTGRAATITARR